MDATADRDYLPILASVLAHALIIVILLFLRFAPIDRPGVPQPIAISLLPPETTLPTDAARMMASGMPAKASAAPPATATAQPPAQPQTPPILSVPDTQATQSRDFPSAALLQPFNQVMQADRTDVRTMQAPPLMLASPPAETDQEEAADLNGPGGMPGTGPLTGEQGGQGKITGAGTAGRGKMEYEFLILAIDQVQRESSISSLKQFTEQLEQCGLTAVKSPDKSWAVTVHVVFDPSGNLNQATVIDPPALPSQTYQTALSRLMQPLQTPGCNHLSLPMERPTWHTGTIYFYPKGNPNMPNEVPDGHFLLPRSQR